MTNLEGYTLRAPTTDDVATVAELIAACQLVDRGAAEMTVDELQDEWDGFNLAEDATLVIAPDGQISAYADIFNRGYVSVSVYGHVHPEHRGRRVGERLVLWGESWAEKNIVHAPIGASVIVQHYILGSNAAARSLLEQQHYQAVRGVYEMAIDLAQLVPEPIWPDGIIVRDFVPGQDERATFEAYEEASEDMWQRPRGVYERWVEFTQRSDPTLLFVAEEKSTSAIAGVCACSMLPGRGHIGGIRVPRAFRRRGLGLALLHHAFSVFRQRGAQVADLSVDAESPTNAPQLYFRAGMHVTRSYVVYQKGLRSESA